MMQEFQRLGDEVAAQWSETGCDAAQFPEIARRCMDAARLHTLYDHDALIRWCFEHAPRPAQLDNAMQYGQPPLTLWNNGRFVVDVYFFLTPESPIHDHDFAGAFMNLCGDSLHCTYKFTPTESASQQVLIGSLKLVDAALLPPGKVQPIAPATLPGTSFIHRVWHLDRPPVICIVRLIKSVADGEAYTYLDNGLVLRELNAGVPFLRKRLRLLSYLFETNHASAEQLAGELILGASAELSLRYLLAYCQILLQQGASDESWSRVRKLAITIEEKHGVRFGDWHELLQMLELQFAIDWTRLHKREHRLLIALLRTFDRREPIEAWLQQLYPQRDARISIAAWLRELAQSGALNLEMSAAHLSALESLLRGDAPPPDQCELWREIQETALFAPLFKAGPLR